MALAAALAALALSPGQASAARTYYVSPRGTGNICTQAAPCNIAFAVKSAVSGDTVIAAGNEGSYGLPESPTLEHLVVANDVTLEGAQGQPRPVLYTEATGIAVELGTGGTGQRLSGFEIQDSAKFGTALLGSGSIDHVFTNAPNTGTGCITRPATTITDSICAGEYGILDKVSGGGLWALTLRNDTIYAAKEAMALNSSGPDLEVTAVNTIFHGPAFDIGAAQLGGTVSVSLDHSNYASVNAEGGAAVTAPGSGTNQTAPPLFVDAGIGDFREAAGSPTIDAGVNEAANGTTDLAGNPRALPGHLTCDEVPPAIADIGAYEFVPVAPPCPPPPGREEKPHAPNTRITAVAVRRHTATFRFRAVRETSTLSFQCELAEEPFRPCGSPKTYKNLRPGKYRFTVRAVGQPGGLDLTPAVRSIQVGRRG